MMSGKIKRLDKTVSNRIAAGEVVQRPVNALKEMIENSLDAQATTIQVLVKAGGLKMLQIQDNGCGIHKDDLDIVCERFTTSKLSKFDDLQSIATYGFRGEALASISHAAHVTITTKTADAQCAFKVLYADGKTKSVPKPCAGNKGTQILVEDLFYNMPQRRKAVKSPSEEHSRIIDLVTRYALHNPHVGFSLKKAGESGNDIHTLGGESTKFDAIQILYGTSVARELLEVKCEDESLKFSMEGLISNANYSVKKGTFLLFVNNRLVDSASFRKALLSVYSAYLPKHTHPFIYLSLQVAPKNVDVNIHPTKNEVLLLNEDLILQKVQQAADARLLGSNTSKTFLTQTLIPRVTESSRSDRQLVRTDHRSQKLDVFLRPKEGNLQPDDEGKSPQQEPTLSSIRNLISEFKKNSHPDVRKLLAEHTFVAVVNEEFALVQHNTRLCIARTPTLSRELFYQIMLRDFGNYGTIRLSEPVALLDLVLLGLKETAKEDEIETLAQKAVRLLCSKAEMLADYFAIEIDENQKLCTLPLLLKGYIPQMRGLPLYTTRLATQVVWTSEQECFRTFCRETARFYVSPPQDPWIVEHVLYPAFKSQLLPPSQFSTNGTLLQLMQLSDLYKVFERC